ncbi:helix-turn-helix transcriptional regulator [Streptomyces sp. NPDC052013]|uniref:helix-turn-helix transcriptional regulator n=1 Tax=Streptomyces sp. NPDC052013 TaxID=3365679 RepID=UPI0037D31D7C
MPADQIDDDEWIHAEGQRIGRRIRQVREHHNLTQEAVVLAVPINRAHYQDIEAGRANPTLRTLLRIARAIGVPIDELFR